MLPTLSPAQLRLITIVARFEQERRPLFVPDLIQNAGLAGESSLTPTLKILQRNGWLEIHGGGKQRNHRLIRLTAKGRHAMGIRGLPLLGAIPAGPLTDVTAHLDEFVEVAQLLTTQPGDFLLKVQGDSMIGDGICEGDLVLLRPGVEVQRGEIAAIYAGENYEATLKRVFIEAESVRLKAGNPAYPDIIVSAAEWRGIAGVYRGLVRNVHR